MTRALASGVLLALLVVAGAVAPAHFHDDRLAPSDTCAVCRVVRNAPAKLGAAPDPAPLLVATPAAPRPSDTEREGTRERARARSPPRLV